MDLLFQSTKEQKLSCTEISINVTGVSVNPARSIGPALFAGGTAIGQLWLFIIAPIIGGLAAGALFKSGLLDSE